MLGCMCQWTDQLSLLLPLPRRTRNTENVKQINRLMASQSCSLIDFLFNLSSPKVFLGSLPLQACTSSRPQWRTCRSLHRVAPPGTSHMLRLVYQVSYQ